MQTVIFGGIFFLKKTKTWSVGQLIVIPEAMKYWLANVQDVKLVGLILS